MSLATTLFGNRRDVVGVGVDADRSPVGPGDHAFGKVADADAVAKAKRPIDADGYTGENVGEGALQAPSPTRSPKRRKSPVTPVTGNPNTELRTIASVAA